MFRLSKWYFDLVTDEGAVLILYAARLQWGGVGIDYASALHSTAAGQIRDESTFRRVEQPRIDGHILTWHNEPLQVEGEWRRDADAVETTLVDGPSGAIRWTCHMPRARAVVRCGGYRLGGLGYVENLSVTIPPSRLPFHTLQWGRHLSAEHALVWIEWDADRRWSWLDGVPGTGRQLRLSESRDLRNGLVLDVVGGLPSVLTRRLAGRAATMHEHKQVSRSALVREGEPVDSGWTIHEVVTLEARGGRREAGSGRREA